MAIMTLGGLFCVVLNRSIRRLKKKGNDIRTDKMDNLIFCVSVFLKIM